MGGYPFGKNDLTIEEWTDLGKAEEFFQAQERALSSSMFLGAPRGRS